MSASVGRARARIGLLGNPGDLYGGNVLAATIDTFETVATVTDTVFYAPASFSPTLQICSDSRSPSCSLEGGDRARLTTDVPVQSGLSGSSAILLATLRRSTPTSTSASSRSRWHRSLGTSNARTSASSPAPRIASSRPSEASSTWTSPAPTNRHPRVSRSRSPPPLLVAWPRSPARPQATSIERSGSAGARRLGIAAVARRICRDRRHRPSGTLDRDTTTFCNAVDANFDLRRSIFTLDDEQAALVTAARAAGAAKFCGSGGAIVAVPRPGTDLDAVADSLGSGRQSAAEFASRSPRRKASRASSP